MMPDRTHRGPENAIQWLWLLLRLLIARRREATVTLALLMESSLLYLVKQLWSDPSMLELDVLAEAAIRSVGLRASGTRVFASNLVCASAMPLLPPKNHPLLTCTAVCH